MGYPGAHRPGFLKAFFMEEKLLTVKISYSDTSKNFFIDFWEEEKYLASVKINQSEAEGISRDTGIKIMIQ